MLLLLLLLLFPYLRKHASEAFSLILTLSNHFTHFKKIVDPFNIFPVTRFSVTSLLRYSLLRYSV